ncbi:hypothetical protein EVAR_98025_1 [Eumeta japonica]|uniref:Uncharacterized protein n=1 Tax=Eumeta variegata TaxID=151549 RepID=A0A4C2A9H4_EUMVA|nr:hypothetical protein EVAR_98025_1 [Eumeta japonica]
MAEHAVKPQLINSKSGRRELVNNGRFKSAPRRRWRARKNPSRRRRSVARCQSGNTVARHCSPRSRPRARGRVAVEQQLPTEAGAGSVAALSDKTSGKHSVEWYRVGSKTGRPRTLPSYRAASSPSPLLSRRHMVPYAARHSPLNANTPNLCVRAPPIDFSDTLPLASTVRKRPRVSSS